MKIRLLFDYGCEFIWLYVDDSFEAVRVSSDGYFAQDYYSSEIINGKIIRKPNGRVWKYPEKRLTGQTKLEETANFIDEQYLKLWINNEYEFSYKGFDSKEDEQRFDDAVRFVYNKLCELLGDDYEIINDTGYGMPEQDNEQDLNQSL